MSDTLQHVKPEEKEEFDGTPMANDDDDFEDDDDDDDDIIRYDESIKEGGEGSNSTVQHSMKHFQPTNKILSK